MTNKSKKNTVVSQQCSDGTHIEAVYSATTKQTQLATYTGGAVSLAASYTAPSGETVYPVSPTNNLIKHGAVLFAEQADPYESSAALVADIETYIQRYVDLSDHFRRLATYYVLLSWVYDAFNELPYLRFRGDYGSGKTRALFVVGSLSYKPFFASGASTVSPIFHTLDSFRGTLIFDEADFRFSDEKSELVKIFNNGNVRGFPVLRTAITTSREFDPRAFNVFGPKIVAMRKAFDDPALESRFLTEEMGQRSLRRDIPINLPDIQKLEATRLRNQLLMYRFRTLMSVRIDDTLADSSLSPRLNQILIPLLSIVADQALRAEILEAVRSYDQKLYQDRASTMEANVLEVLQELYAEGGRTSISIAEITNALQARFGSEYGRPITARVVGGVLRTRLRLLTWKSHGIYVLPASEQPKVAELCVRYGVAAERHEP